MARHTTRGPAARLAGGLAALLTLAALLAGIPAALYLLTGNPLQDLGQLDDLLAAVARPDDGTLLTGALVWIGWAGWATFALAFLIEIVSHLAGWRPRVLGLRLQQRVCAALIAAIVSAIVSPAAASAQAAFTATTPVVLVVDAPHLDTDTAGQRTTPASERTGPRFVEHTATRTEALLDVADRYGVAPEAIAEASYGLRQPDGRTMQRGQTLIRAGWTVRIPLGTTTATAAPAAANVTQQAVQGEQQQLVYTVDRNDWLFYIAQRYLGDGERYPEIAKLNPQYAGRHNAEHTRHFPDHIETGWRLKLPAGAYDRGENRHSTGKATPLTPPAAATPVQPPAETPGEPSTQPTPAPSITPSPAPSVEPSALPSNTATATPAAADPAQTPAGQDQDDSGDELITVASGLAAASLLSGLVVMLLRRRRRSQQQHRRAGRRIATPADATVEVAARAAARPADVSRLDAALRLVAEHTQGRPPADLPDIAAAWLDQETVSFILASPCTPPAPFSAAGAAAWTLPAGTVVDVDPEEHLSPAPALMTLGAQPASQDGDQVHLLIDAERAGLLSITGDPRRCQDLLRYLAAEAAASSWGDDSVVLVAGLSPDDTAALIALNEGRVRAHTSVADALARAGRRAQAGASALRDAGAHDALDGRINHNEGQTWAPQLLFVSDLDGAHTAALQQLDGQLKDATRSMVAVVAITAQPTAWSLHVDADGNVSMPWLATQNTSASQLSAAQLADLAATITKARPHPQRTTVFDHLPDGFDYPFDEPVPAAAEEWAAGTDAHGHLLGGIAEEFADADDTGDGEGGEGQLQEPALLPEPVARVNGHSQLAAAAATARRPLPDDPTLDADLAAWNDAEKTRPCIGILGSVVVEAPGFVPDERLRFYAEVVVFLAQRGRRGATAEEIIANLWMDEPIGRNSLRVALSRVRRWLGEDPEGQPWMPGNSSGEAPYRLKDGYLLDWHLFRRVRARGEARGNAGVADLRAALELVRGVPLDGADHRHGSNKRTPYAWLPNSEIPPYHLTAAIVDTAHTLVGLCLEAGDHDGARWAVDRAWTADPEHTDDHPWQDRMRIAAAEGRDAELRAIVADLMHARGAEALVDLSKSTYAVILELGLDTVLQDA